jgi:dihydroorotate dehydrogenase (NAD+) catalytic subunit
LPRIAETPSGLLNSIGLENPGISAFLAEILPALEGIDTKVIASVAGNRAGDIEFVAGRLGDRDRVDALELNVSCPNQAEGGMAFGTNPRILEDLVARVRKVYERPLMVKLSPNVTDIVGAARAAQSGGADMVSLVNTFLGLMVDWRTRRPMIAGLRGRGGVSGPAIKPMALRMVRDVFEAVDLPIVGIGGIACADDVLDFIVCGASAVQVGTANFLDPGLAARLPGELSRLLAGGGIEHLDALRGTLADGP